MGGKGSGRYKSSQSSTVAKSTTHPPRVSMNQTPPPVRGKAQGKAPGVDYESFSYRSIEMGKELMLLPTIDDWSEPEPLQERFFEILEICQKWQIPPNVSNVALGFGIGSELFVDICLGRCPRYKLLTQRSMSLCKKIYAFLKQNMENSLVNERGNPVKWIFLGKNYFGFTDQTETVVRHVDEKAELPQSSNVIGKYAGIVGTNSPELPQAELVSVESVENKNQEPEYETLESPKVEENTRSAEK